MQLEPPSMQLAPAPSLQPYEHPSFGHGFGQGGGLSIGQGGGPAFAHGLGGGLGSSPSGGPPQPDAEGLTPAFAQRFSALHAELANTILSELSSNPDLPRETHQALIAQLQTSIGHTKQPTANAWRAVGVRPLLSLQHDGAVGDPPTAGPPHQPPPHQPHQPPQQRGAKMMPLADLAALPSPHGPHGPHSPYGKALPFAAAGAYPPKHEGMEGAPDGDSAQDSASFLALTRLFRDPHACGHLTDEAASTSEGSGAKHLAAGVTLKLRHLLLRQNKLTNRFEGSSFARHAETTYASEVTRTQLPTLTRRLAFFAFLLPTISLAHAPRRLDTWLIIAQQVLSI